MHDRLLGAAVEHLDVEPNEDDAIRYSLVEPAPQFGVAVPLAEPPGLDQGLVGAHADLRAHVVAFCLAQEWVEAGARVEAFPKEGLESVHQSVLVRAMQRIARLEGDDTLPASSCKQVPRLRWREDVTCDARVPGPGKDLYRATE